MNATPSMLRSPALGVALFLALGTAGATHAAARGPWGATHAAALGTAHSRERVIVEDGPDAASDALILQCASEQGWRELVDALERVAPPRTDEARSAFERARLRIDATDPRRSSVERARAWTALDAAHERRVAAAPDPRVRREAVAERATDALRIGLFAEPSTASALASADPADAARALALLRGVEAATVQDGPGGSAAGTDATIAFLHVASQALQVGIDRADRGGAASRDRRTRAASLLERVRAAREGIPPALGAVADLAECAAASAAGDADAARAAAVRIVYLGEPLPAMFGRILVCDALAESRLGDRALTELVQVIRVDGLSLPLRILAADAYVRLRNALGKSSLAGPTFEAYAEVIRQSPAPERWAARLAVIERLGPITARALDTSWLPPDGLVARAHAQRVAGDVAAGEAIRAELAETSPDRASMAAVAALDASIRAHDAALAADALKTLATRFPDDPAWKGCPADLAMLEIAHDAAHPDSRPGQLKASIVLAIALADDASRLSALGPAQQAVEALERARSSTMTPADAATRLAELVTACTAADAESRAGTRVHAAMLVLDACAIDPAGAAASPRPDLPAALEGMHPSDAHLLGRCLAERARDAAGSPAAATAAARLRALGTTDRAAAHAARGARDVVAASIASPSGLDPKVARGLAAVLDAAANIDAPTLDAMRLDVSLASRWGGLSRSAAADRTSRARAAADHDDASQDDLLALADALLDEATLVQPPERPALLAEAMDVARLAESMASRGQTGELAAARKIDWSARERMVRAARIAGRADQVDAHIRRLVAIDPTFGGNPGRFSAP
ncbi:MAG: hypothetical protein FGM37_04000 [Phycisphaerales bacterium]|nr:hypothetical protein [Phycisphaerales bacterium]